MLVSAVRFIPLMAHVSSQIEPGNAVSALDEIRVCDGAEGLANVGGVGYVSLGGEHDLRLVYEVSICLTCNSYINYVLVRMREA
jgi:hypothetical protein